MVKKRAPKRNRPASKKGKINGIPTPLLWLALPLFAAAACWWTGLDATLAKLVYVPDSHWAWQLRQYGTLPATVLTVLAFLVVLATGLRLMDADRRPTLHTMALTTILTTVLGAGLIAQVLVQEIIERPRPRESVLIENPAQTELRGQSFPSGHAAIGFVLAAPAFAFAVGSRRRRAWLALGMGWGLALGAARMVLGAHFLGDILASMGLVLGSAALFAPVAARIRRIPFWLTMLFIFAALMAVILGNRFTVDLTVPRGQTWSRLNLPCNSTLSTPVTPSAGQKSQVAPSGPASARSVPTFAPSGPYASPTLVVRLKGYGAPLSTLKLHVDDQGVVTLGTRQGLYHSLSCTATILLPAE